MTDRRTAAEALLIMAVAGALWGSSFALVDLLAATSPVLVTGLRFGAYGLVSAVILLLGGGYRGIDWRVALFHAATGYVGMYLAEVTAIHLAGPAPTIAVVGSSPVVYAWLGSRRDGIDPRVLRPSVAVIAVALAMINATSWTTGGRPLAGIVLGLVVAAFGVASWCVYALHNTNHLRSSPAVSPLRWSSAVGVASGVLALPLIVAGLEFGGGTDPALELGSVILYLAIGPSWLAAALWNRASVKVPRALAGQLIVFEPISGFALVHLLSGRLPSPPQLTGEVLLVMGAVIALGSLSRGRVAIDECFDDRLDECLDVCFDDVPAGSSQSWNTGSCRSASPACRSASPTMSP